MWFPNNNKVFKQYRVNVFTEPTLTGDDGAGCVTNSSDNVASLKIRMKVKSRKRTKTNLILGSNC